MRHFADSAALIVFVTLYLLLVVGMLLILPFMTVGMLCLRSFG